jgi:hypothetical protein
MPIVPHNPPGLFPPYRACSHPVEVRGGKRLLVISGLIGYERRRHDARVATRTGPARPVQSFAE